MVNSSLSVIVSGNKFPSLSGREERRVNHFTHVKELKSKLRKVFFLPSSVFLLLAIFLFARAQIVFEGVYPYKKIAWLHGR